MATNRRQFFSLIGGATVGLFLPGTVAACLPRRRSVCGPPMACVHPAVYGTTTLAPLSHSLEADANAVGPEGGLVEFAEWLSPRVSDRYRAPNGTDEFVYVAFSCRRLSGTFDELPRA